MKLITGLHHVSAITGNAQRDMDFYAQLLGLRLVKKTVNFDNPEVYHLYFGNNSGEPGTIMTTFPYGAELNKGRHGTGRLNTTAFSLDIAGLDYWIERLERYDISYKNPQQRGSGEVFIYLEDFNGLGLELVFSEKDKRSGYANPEISPDYAIKGLHHVEIWLDAYERTASLLTQQMDHHVIHESSGWVRLGPSDAPGKYVDLIANPSALRGQSGRGMVHHVAFGIPDADAQQQLIDRLDTAGIKHTEIRDRYYFQSIYFTEPGGVIFEVATNQPGFTRDEPVEELGNALSLPLQFENRRKELNDILPKLERTS